jgi:hypothetical protein
MDFRKFENKQFVLESAQGNIVKFFEIYLSFTEYAKNRELCLHSAHPMKRF